MSDISDLPVPSRATQVSSDLPAPPKEPSLGKKLGAMAYGAGTGLVGGFGELEEFGAYTLPEFLGLRDKDKRDKFMYRETIFPTVKEAQEALSILGIQKPAEDVSGYQTVGEILGGFGTSLPRVIRGGVRSFVGTPSATSAQYAKAAEDLGFKLSPAQVRQDIPVPAKGATTWAAENQTLANRLASGSTGVEVKEISPTFIRERLSDLGKEYDKLYKGKLFAVDSNAENALNNILSKEQELGVAGVSTVKQAAQTMIDFISSKGYVRGDDLQRLRNALTERARSSSSRGNAHEIYDLVDVIDGSIAKMNEGYKQTLDILRPQYRNTIILEDLNRAGGISQGNISLERLGNMLGGGKGGLRTADRYDIDKLGEMGRQLRMRARWETEGRAATTGEDLLGKALGTGADLAGTLTGARSRYARALQRRINTEGINPRTLLPEAIAAGTAARPFQKEE